MNHWQEERMAEYRRQESLAEVEQIRLETVALRSRGYRPGIFAGTMYKLANWMISTGKELRKRYEIPAVNCSKTESFVH